jgi:diguanylate cyclase (GGDEF)-like protein
MAQAGPNPIPDAPTVGALDRMWRVLAPALLRRQGALLAVKRLSDGAYVHINPAMAAYLGRDSAQIVGHVDAELFAPAVALALRAADQTAAAKAEPMTSEHGFEREGRRQDFEVMRLVLPGPDGERWVCSVWTELGAARQREAQFQALLAQMEQQQQANEQLRRELADHALRDQASGLHTGTHFEEQLRRELDLSSREHREFALVLIEVDPPQGEAQAAAAQERVFEAMGALLRGGTRAMDASCRVEGRRFAVLLSGVGLATAHSRMESLRRQCATQIVLLAGKEVRFTVSMGVASFPHTAGDRDQLMASSETALQQARGRGGNQVTLASIRFDHA